MNKMKGSLMRFSLILATKGRIYELERFLQALNAQTYRDFELIVVDQNPDDRLVPLLAGYHNAFALTHLRSRPGLSHARNVGLDHASGDIVAFPDDDCWYPDDLLGKISTFWGKQPSWDGLLGIWDDPSGGGQPAASLVKPINIFNATTCVISWILFLTRQAVHKVNGFDEELGLGAGTRWGGGEDIDITIRCLKSGFRICHNPMIKVYHPDPRKGCTDAHRGYLYGTGMGRVLRKHGYPSWFVCYHLLRSLAAAGWGVVRGHIDQTRYYWSVFRGKWAGWRGE